MSRAVQLHTLALGALLGLFGCASVGHAPHDPQAEHPSGASGEAAPPKPNLVLIVADDLGYADVGFQGCLDIPTPNIDRIANEGARFTNGYVTAAVCGPSRAGFITGRYQDRFGSSRNPTIDPTVPNGVPRSERTIAELLKPAGYNTMLSGKWHLGTYPGLQPRDRGFDEFFGFLSGGHDYFPQNLKLNDISEVRKKWGWYRTRLIHNGRRVDIDDYLTDELSDAAVDFIDRKAGDEPFFVYLSYNAPHTPMQATEEYLARFSGIGDERRRTYAAMVSAMDDGIGRVLDALDRSGEADSTLVVFLSDNGGAANNASDNTPLRGRKSHPWEGGVRVPFAMRWPDAIEPRTVYPHPISSLDIAGTIVAAAGPEAQSALLPDKPLDGVNLVPYLNGTEPGRPHEVLYWRWYDQGMYALRAADEKLIVSSSPSDFGGLYDLAADVGEQSDLSRSPGSNGAVERLEGLAEAWFTELVPPAYPGLGSWDPAKQPRPAP